MDDAYPKVTCPHCGQQLRFADVPGVNEMIRPDCSAPVLIDAGQKAVASQYGEAGGKEFFWENKLPAEAKTNSLGAAMEGILADANKQILNRQITRNFPLQVLSGAHESATGSPVLRT